MTTLDTVVANAVADANKTSAAPASTAGGTTAAAPAVPPANAGANQAVNEAAVIAAVNAAVSQTRILAADIMTMALTAGVPAMAVPLVKEGSSLEHARTRIDGAKEITNAVAQAAAICPSIDAKTLTAQFVAAGASVEHVKAKLFETVQQVQAATPQVSSTHQAQAGNAPADQAAINKSWADAVTVVENGGKKKKAA